MGRGMIKPVHKYTTLIKFLSPCHNFSYQISPILLDNSLVCFQTELLLSKFPKKQFCNFTVSNSPDSSLELALQVKNRSYD